MLIELSALCYVDLGDADVRSLSEIDVFFDIHDMSDHLSQYINDAIVADRYRHDDVSDPYAYDINSYSLSACLRSGEPNTYNVAAYYCDADAEAAHNVEHVAYHEITMSDDAEQLIKDAVLQAIGDVFFSH